MGWIGFTLLMMPAKQAAEWLRRIATGLEQLGDRTLLGLPMRERMRRMEDLASAQLDQLLRGDTEAQPEQLPNQPREGRRP